MTADEAEELTHFGNEVLHPFTMMCAIEEKVPISILNTFKLSSPGTTIVDSFPGEQEQPPQGDAARSYNAVRAVCSKKNIRVLSLNSRRNETSEGSDVDSSIDDSEFLAKVFALLDKHGVRVDVISTSITNLSIACLPKTEALRADFVRLQLNCLVRPLHLPRAGPPSCATFQNRVSVDSVAEGL